MNQNVTKKKVVWEMYKLVTFPNYLLILADILLFIHFSKRRKRYSKLPYSADRDLSSGWRYPSFEQPGPGILNLEFVNVHNASCNMYTNKTKEEILLPGVSSSIPVGLTFRQYVLEILVYTTNNHWS